MEQSIPNVRDLKARDCADFRFVDGPRKNTHCSLRAAWATEVSHVRSVGEKILIFLAIFDILTWFSALSVDAFRFSYPQKAGDDFVCLCNQCWKILRILLVGKNKSNLSTIIIICI